MTETELRGIFGRLEHLDAAQFAQRFTPQGVLRIGNAKPAVGIEAIGAALEQLFELLEGLQHRFVHVWQVSEGFVIEAEITYIVRGGAGPVSVGAVIIARVSGDRFTEVRLAADLSPVFAAAQAARRHEAPIELKVEHEEEDSGGRFVMRRDGETLAEMTYSRTPDGKRIIIDHTEVTPKLKGQGAGRKLVESAVSWARAEQVSVLPLCPFARSVFDREPVLRDVLWNSH